VEWILAAAVLAFIQVPSDSPHPTPAEQQRAAMEMQRAAARKQAETVGARLKPWGEVTVEAGPSFESAKPECDALADSIATPLVDGAAKEQGVDAKLLRAVIDQESGFHPCAISSKGAQGLMQLMPGTADLLQVADPFDPKENIEAGAKYLKQLLDKNGGDIAKALGAYNAGPNTDDPADKIPETKAYVDAILTKMGIKHTDPQSIQMPKPIGN
jgi:soluble lytic murein transglycosylase-like protein